MIQPLSLTCLIKQDNFNFIIKIAHRTTNREMGVHITLIIDKIYSHHLENEVKRRLNILFNNYDFTNTKIKFKEPVKCVN